MQTTVPQGILIARDGKSTPTPPAPADYPHKVEVLDTHLPSPQWALICVCVNPWRPNIELAEYLHSRFGKANHIDQCGWDYETWTVPGSGKGRYLEQAGRVPGYLRAHGITAQNAIQFLQGLHAAEDGR